jgi:hypothetical protein
MTAFDDDFQEEALPDLSSTFGETGTYFRRDGGSLSGTCFVDESGNIPDDELGLIDSQEIFVTVQRRTIADNPDALVIDNPQLGDGFRRENDPDERHYSFAGDKFDVTVDRWRLRFIRDVPRRVGGNTRRK